MWSTVIRRLKFTDGRTVLCPKSTLIGCGGYLATRFGGSDLPAGGETNAMDDKTTNFIPRDGNLFEKFIWPHLMDNVTTEYLEPFTDNPVLWRRLRKEAEFYALDGLLQALYVTHSVSRNIEGEGILYWLGTKKGKQPYQNPCASRMVSVGGWVDEPERVRGANPHYGVASYAFFALSKHRQVLVQHQPAVCGPSLEGKTVSRLMWCDMTEMTWPVVVDLKSISVRLTQYSLRYESCCGGGMRSWRFEGSKDGKQWELLHEVVNDCQLDPPSDEERDGIHFLFDEAEVFDEKTREDMLLRYAERNHRGYWDVSTTEFYRCFRFIGFGPGEHRGCMHGTGLELYGDVHED